MWVVAVGTSVFVRSYRGPGARWYRDVQRVPAVRLRVRDLRLDAELVPAAPGSTLAVDEAYAE